MYRLTNILLCFTIFIAIALLVSAFRAYTFDELASAKPEPSAALTIVAPAQPIFAAIGSQEVVVQVTNHGGSNPLILGMKEGCGPKVCYSWLLDEPVRVSPGETKNIRFEVKVKEAVPFTFPLVLYVNDSGVYSTLSCLIEGVVGADHFSSKE